MDLDQIYSGDKGGDFPELHHVITDLKSWLRDVHHHVNDLQDYLNEYCYRFNKGFMKENIFDNLLNRMVISKPCPKKILVSKCLSQKNYLDFLKFDKSLKVVRMTKK